MKLFALFAYISFLTAAPPAIAAQQRGSQPVAVLVDVINRNIEVPATASPKKARPAGVSIDAPFRDLERRIFQKINDARTANGLAPLVWNDQIAEIARVHSQNMVEYKFFGHQDQDGLTVDGRAESYGLTSWKGIGENIASLQGFKDPAPVAVEKWLQSPGHRQNILGGRWSESAVGVAEAKDGTYYFTQVFMLR